MDAVRWLRECDLTVVDVTPADGTDAGADAVLEIETGDRSGRFAVQAKSRAPYPHELERLKQSWPGLAARGQPLIVAPFISEHLGSSLTRDGWSWADTQGNFDLRAPGLLLRQRRSSTPPTPKRKTLPRGSGSFAVVRALVGFSGGGDEELGATALAAQAGVSQPRASQILHQLHQLELVDRSGRGRWEPRREALLDRFLAEYPGPGGSEQHYYSLDSPLEVAVRAGQVESQSRRGSGIGRRRAGSHPGLAQAQPGDPVRKARDRSLRPRADPGAGKARRQRDHAHSARPVRIPSYPL